MRGSLPSSESVIALMGAVAMEKGEKTYNYPLWTFKDVEMLKKKIDLDGKTFRYASFIFHLNF